MGLPSNRKDEAEDISQKAWGGRPLSTIVPADLLQQWPVLEFQCSDYSTTSHNALSYLRNCQAYLETAKMTRTTLHHYSHICLQIANIPTLYLYSPSWKPAKQKTRTTIRIEYMLSLLVCQFSFRFLYWLSQRHHGPHTRSLTENCTSFLVIRY
jgi:hypothetical protein